jgi:hypothetical protein
MKRLMMTDLPRDLFPQGRSSLLHVRDWTRFRLVARPLQRIGLVTVTFFQVGAPFSPCGAPNFVPVLDPSEMDPKQNIFQFWRVFDAIER